uniref:Uncharacterized protein n=1 Tax=Panagrolaimus davidi TaxID=227884 RepID=A0A914PPS6_9BILA
MTDINEFIQKFTNLPPFPNEDDEEILRESIYKIFDHLDLDRKIDPYFCCQTVITEGNKEWDIMLYICDEKIPIVAFHSAGSLGYWVFVDCYGNKSVNELKLMESINCSKYYKYYNVKKIFTLTPFRSDEEYLKSLIKNYEMLGCNKIAIMMEIFIEHLRPENAVKALKMIKNFYRFFLQLVRNIDRINELQIGDFVQILVIKLYEERRKIYTTIEVNLEKFVFYFAMGDKNLEQETVVTKSLK